MEWKKSIVGLAIDRGAQVDLPTGVSRREAKDLIEVAYTMLNQRDPKTKDSPPLWGFKIPHLLWCFPLLAETFPNSRFIHLTRHPVPCSIGKEAKGSDKTSRAGGQGKTLLPPAIEYSTGKVMTKRIDPRDKSIQEKLNAYSWNHSVGRGCEYGRRVLGDRYLEIRYEDICSNPQAADDKIAEFLDLPTKKTGIVIKPSPSSVYEKSPEAKEAWDICKNTAKKIGYKY